VVQVVQVGDAVLVTRTAEPHGPGATDLTAFEADVAREIELLGPVVDAMTALVSGTGAPRA
jgi:hypothetical protein